MKIYTRRMLASYAYERFSKKYSVKDFITPGNKRISCGMIIRDLKNLGESPDPDDVDRVIGNGSWTRVPKCSECYREDVVIIEIGQEPDYEQFPAEDRRARFRRRWGKSETAYLCRSCLKKAYDEMEKEIVKEGKL